MRRFLLLWIAALAFSGCSAMANCGDTQATQACVRVLFIGNSYTYVNDLPNVFAELSRSGGHIVETGMAAQGGWSLSNHVNSSDTNNKLGSSKWGFVILQEQSQLPAVKQFRTLQMYPAARLLVRKIIQTGATPIFFMTWAHRDGWPENGLPDYESMQSQIDGGYLEIAQELKVPVGPVGYAWLAAKRQNPELDLWQADGSHPTEQGTYLASCIFYAVIFRTSPVGLTYTAHLSAETAKLLQTIAANTVLNNPTKWNLR